MKKCRALPKKVLWSQRGSWILISKGNSPIFCRAGTKVRGLQGGVQGVHMGEILVVLPWSLPILLELKMTLDR